VAVSYMGLGDVYESLGKFEEALEMHTKSLDIQTRIHGGDHHSRYCATAHDI
jgi:tetratricopeptide (TPR) repeat protein